MICNIKGLSVSVAATLLVGLLTGCNEETATADKRARLMRPDVMQTREGQVALTLTGSVQARFHDYISFHVSGRVIERLSDVGQHVEKGQLLARLDASDEQSELLAASQAVAASEARLRLVQTSLADQNILLTNAVTTTNELEQAQMELRSAEFSVEISQAKLGAAKKKLKNTELRADAAGVITRRALEVGQVVWASQPVFSIGEDGERDAIFEMPASPWLREFGGDDLLLRLVSNPAVTAIGHVRDISAVVEGNGSTVRVAVAIVNPPAGDGARQRHRGRRRMQTFGSVLRRFAGGRAIDRQAAVVSLRIFASLAMTFAIVLK